MSTIRIYDLWLKNSKAAEEVRNYLIDSDAVHDATLTFAVGIHGNLDIELMVMLNDDHPHSDSVEPDIHEILIQARLDFVQGGMLKLLAWKFSSPAQTSKLKELLEAKKNII